MMRETVETENGSVVVIEIPDTTLEKVEGMTLTERIEAGIETLSPYEKLVDNERVPKTAEELLADGIITQAQYYENQIEDLKEQLRETDYCVIKITEGSGTLKEYAELIAQRKEWRSQINELLSKIEQLEEEE